MANTKVIEIGNKKYTLTASRALIKVVYKLMPEKFYDKDKVEDITDNDKLELGIDFYVKLGDVFYEMIHIAHPEIDRYKTEDILFEMEKEYGRVESDNAIMNFALSPFTQGVQGTPKKKLDW